MVSASGPLPRSPGQEASAEDSKSRNGELAKREKSEGGALKSEKAVEAMIPTRETEVNEVFGSRDLHQGVKTGQSKDINGCEGKGYWRKSAQRHLVTENGAAEFGFHFSLDIHSCA